MTGRMSDLLREALESLEWAKKRIGPQSLCADALGYIKMDCAIDELRAALAASGWRDIATAPYDEICLFLIDGRVVETFYKDGTPDEMFGPGRATHWMPRSALPEPPK